MNSELIKWNEMSVSYINEHKTEAVQTNMYFDSYESSFGGFMKCAMAYAHHDTLQCLFSIRSSVFTGSFRIDNRPFL
jgi:hypothetical protein